MSLGFTAYNADLKDRLVGRWVTNNVMGHMELTLTLRLDSTGSLEIENPACCDRYPIHWGLDGGEHIYLPGSGAVFRTERPYFEIGCFRNPSGALEDMLRIFDGGQEKHPWEFFRPSGENENADNENG